MNIKKIVYCTIIGSILLLVGCSSTPEESPKEFIKKYITEHEHIAPESLDLSGLSVKIVDEKEEYVNDEINVFAKVSTSGSYTVKNKGEQEEHELNNTFILISKNGHWVMSENINPWL